MSLVLVVFFDYRGLTLSKLGEMLLPPAPVCPALVDRCHLLTVALNYIKRTRWVLLRLQLKARVTCAQQVSAKGRKRSKVLGHGKGVGQVESV